MALTKVVPGKTSNAGIGDESVPPSVPQLPSSSCHATTLSLPTPKGKLGQQNISMGDLTALYGDLTDPHTPYYNAITQAIALMASGGQSAIAIRRVSGNTVIARVAVGIALTPNQKVPQYQRNADDTYALDTSGARIPDTSAAAVAGYDAEIVLIDVTNSATGAYGALKITQEQVSDGVTKITYPLFELPAGIGDAYNRMGMMAGQSSTADWSAIAEFVEEYGIFPFVMKMYEKSKTGVPVYAATQQTNAQSATFTLQAMMDENNTRYSLKQAVGAFTGDNVNRPHISAAAPFYDVFVYQQNIDDVCRSLYAAEAKVSQNALITVDGVQPFFQMNPLSFVNHNGAPYYAINDVSKVSYFNLATYMDAAGGISPFLTADLQPAGPVTGTYQFDPSKNNGVADKLSMADAWSVTQALILPDIQAYAQSLEITDVIRNHQSVIWDFGYNQDIKSALIQVWNARKDQILILHAGEWLKTMTQDQLYSSMEALVTKGRLYPESDRYGTPAARAAVNLWDGKIINESTGENFPLTLDLAYFFSLFGGNAKGMLAAINSPDHGDNRILTKMYAPTVEFEADNPSANNFDEGAITIRPYDDNQFYRPALPTIYSESQSVLKDLVTTFTAVCIEKILQNTWVLVSGDTTIDADTYAATVKDKAEAAIRSRMGSMVRDIRIDTFYDETSPNSRSVMRATANVWFRKGKYMMDMDLLAFNEQDETTTTSA